MATEVVGVARRRTVSVRNWADGQALRRPRFPHHILNHLALDTEQIALALLRRRNGGSTR